jgi:hypothetical protein
MRRGGPSDIGSARRRVAMDIIVPVAVGALTAGFIVGAVRLGSPRLFYSICLPAMLTFSQLKRSGRFALSIGSMLLGASLAGAGDAQVLYSDRTFFGVYRVKLERTLGGYHSLVHGTTLHGMQAVDRARQKQPLTYYDRTGPFGQAFAQLPRASSAPEIAVVGLGIGSLASYAGVEQRWTFYEIDPAVERIARSPQYFTYLRDCGSRCQVVLGDARLSLASARPHQYALIVLDAFSSDAIPVHLMTAEALALFLTRLAPGGALAFHVSNRHLSLGPVLTRLALSQGLTVLEQHDDVTAAQIANGKAASDWVVMARDSSDLGPLIADARWRTPVVKASTPLWTDDFSNILSVLNFDLANSPLLQRSGAK